MTKSIIDKRNTKILRFKVIRPVYETMTVELTEDIDVDSPITDSKQLAGLFQFLINETREHFIVLHLNSKNKILAIDRVSTGSINATVVHPMEVMKSALMSSCAAIVCIHNHPSGNPEPSREDKEITKRLKDAADILGIRLLDHIIIGDGDYMSFSDRGLIETSKSNLATVICAGHKKENEQ